MNLNIKEMNFGKAIEALKQGKKVTRKGWNGKKMFLYYVPEGLYPARTDAAKSIADENGKVQYGPYIAMKTAQGNVVPWLASQTDMLSEDWEIVGECENKRPIEQPLDECRMGEEIEAIVRGIEKWAEADKENRPYIFIGYDKKQSQVVYLRGGRKTMLSFALYESMKKDESLKSFLLTTLVGEKIMSTMFK